jgi:hypothetical protein
MRKQTTHRAHLPYCYRQRLIPAVECGVPLGCLGRQRAGGTNRRTSAHPSGIDVTGTVISLPPVRNLVSEQSALWFVRRVKMAEGSL